MIIKEPKLRIPSHALIVVGFAVVFMIGWSLAQWMQMAPEIITQEGTDRRGTMVVSRSVTAVSMPLMLLVLTLLLMLAPTWEEKLASKIFSAQPRRVRGSVRALGAALVGLSVVLSALHVALISLHLDAQIPIERLIGAAVGAFLVTLGVYLPIARPDGSYANPKLEAFRSAQGPAYRLAGFAMVGIGLFTILSAWLQPALMLSIAIGGTVIICASILVYAFVKAGRA